MRKNSTCFVFLAGVLGVKILGPRSVARASRRREGSALQRIPHVQRLFYATPRRRGFPGLTSVGACSYTVRFARLAPIGFAPRSGGLVSGVLDSTSLLLFTTLLFTTLLFTTLLLSCFIGSPAPSMVPFKGLLRVLLLPRPPAVLPPPSRLPVSIRASSRWKAPVPTLRRRRRARMKARCTTRPQAPRVHGWCRCRTSPPRSLAALGIQWSCCAQLRCPRRRTRRTRRGP